MIKINIFVFLLLIAQSYCNNFDQFRDALGHIKIKVLPEIQEQAVRDLIKRIVHEEAKLFTVKITPADQPDNQFFKINTLNGTINLEGTTGVEIATAFNYYLKYYCNSHTSWNENQLGNISVVQDVNITVKMNDRFRYYQNVCTTSYSFVWWDWAQWEKHIDWIVMNSYNLVLTLTGQEAIWDRVYRRFNLTDDDINEHFTGPAFLSWLRMGNIRGWAGPLSKAWHKRTLYLQKQIAGRLRTLGVHTVMPAFAGHVPVAFKRLYPNVNMTRMERWNNFNDSYCCPYFISPTEKLFKKIGKAFLDEILAEFGSGHFYSCDSFNEVDPASTDLTYLANVAKGIYSTMLEVDKDAIWLLQGWMFYYSQYWKDLDRVKSFLNGVPKGKILVLDLQSEQFPQYERLQQYFGQPYIWCMLHNFGGTLGMFGSFDILNSQPIVARSMKNSTMIGTGLTPEGINQNYVVYEFMSEAAFRKDEIETKQWMENFVERRYGVDNPNLKQAWNILLKSIYNYKGLNKIRNQYALVKTPSWNINVWFWYEISDFETAAVQFLSQLNEILSNNPTYIYDFIDIGRQLYQENLDRIYVLLKQNFQNKDLASFDLYADLFVNTLLQMNNLLYFHKGFMLGTWLEMAKNCANDSKEAELFEYNARNQISLWGPNGEIDNYAAKQWHGVVSDLYLPRWEMFLNYSRNILENNGTFDQKYIRNEMFKKVEEPFTKSTNIYPTVPKSSLLGELTDHSKYILDLRSFLKDNQNSEKIEEKERMMTKVIVV